MATSMQRRTMPSTFGLFPLLTRDIDLLQSSMRRMFQGNQSVGRGDLEVDLPQALAWVPPVEISSTPNSFSPRAKSTTPVLSVTLSKARWIFGMKPLF